MFSNEIRFTLARCNTSLETPTAQSHSENDDGVQELSRKKGNQPASWFRADTYKAFKT